MPVFHINVLDLIRVGIGVSLFVGFAAFYVWLAGGPRKALEALLK